MLIHWLLVWVLSAFSLIIVAHIIPGIKVNGLGAALIAALAIGLVNATLGLLLKIITFPFEVLTLGLMWLIVNALMLRLASALVSGFRVNGFLSAFFGAILLSIFNMIFRYMLGRGGY